MISYKQHRVSLMNLDVTFNAIEDLDALIKYYSEDKPGPAYVITKHPAPEKSLQIDRKIFVPALVAQREQLVQYLANIGIDYNA